MEQKVDGHVYGGLFGGETDAAKEKPRKRDHQDDDQRKAMRTGNASRSHKLADRVKIQKAPLDRCLLLHLGYLSTEFSKLRRS
jgi:hypothetical protein